MTKLATVDIKGKEYVPVNERIRAFREAYKGYRLVSEIISHDNGIVIMKAEVMDDRGEVIATGHAYEREGSTYINKTSYIENCETSAWGRALANLGIGIDANIASYEEVASAMKQQDVITNAQGKELLKMAGGNADELKRVLKDIGIQSLREMPADQYEYAKEVVRLAFEDVEE